MGVVILSTLNCSNEKQLRTKIRQLVLKRYPEAIAGLYQNYGIISDSASFPLKKRLVVLIHGLDEPGFIWKDLKVAFAKSKIDFVEFCYPNDQPIMDSTRFLAENIQTLGKLGVQELILVGHSMGGLVARAFVSLPEIDYSSHHARGQYPNISSLIQVGTPNQGSDWARLRVFLEIRDHSKQILEGDWKWWKILADGAGEAKIDLLPNSDFLKNLNLQKIPPSIHVCLIAGHWNIGTNDPIQDWVNHFGDGVVSVSSVWIEGQQNRHLLSGNHISLLRNYLWNHQGTPAAISIIIETIHSSNF